MLAKHPLYQLSYGPVLLTLFAEQAKIPHHESTSATFLLFPHLQVAVWMGPMPLLLHVHTMASWPRLFAWEQVLECRANQVENILVSLAFRSDVAT